MVKNSYQLFEIIGIPIKLHIVFILFFPILVFSIWSYILTQNATTKADPSLALLYATFAMAFLFFSVLIHEIVHAIIARKNKIKVKQIILTPIGGIASVGLIRNAKKEFFISIAGPLSNFVIAFILFLLLASVFGFTQTIYYLFRFTPYREVSIPSLIMLCLYLNGFLGMFNLFFPVFPMDGGRILRAMMAMVTDYLSATKITIQISRIFLILFFIAGVTFGSILWVLITIFLYFAGKMELKAVEISTLMDKFDITQFAQRPLIALYKTQRIEDILRVIVPWQQIYPVINSNGVLKGVITLETLCEKKIGKLEDVMDKDVSTVTTKKSDEVVEKLYNYGYVLLKDKDHRLCGIITLDDIEKAVELSKVMQK